MIEFQGSSPIKLRASCVQEQRSVPHKQLGILKLRPVIRVGVDDELRIRDVLLHDEGVDRGQLEGFASVMEGVRNAAAGLKGRAISGPHGYEQIPALIERSKQRVANFYTDFESRLKDVEFVVGDRFSAADITTLVTVDFATQAFAMPIPDDSVALKRWYDASSECNCLAAIGGGCDGRPAGNKEMTMIMPSLNGKTALVTGASRGMERASALALASAGAQVLVHY